MRLIPITIICMLFLMSCNNANPSDCECKENLDLVVNFEKNASKTYIGQFDKHTYEACIKNFKEKKDIDSNAEVLVKKVYKEYRSACLD